MSNVWKVHKFQENVMCHQGYKRLESKPRSLYDLMQENVEKHLPISLVTKPSALPYIDS